MKTTLKLITLVLIIILFVNNSFSQGNGPLINYYETQKYYLAVYHPDVINPSDLPYGRVYFDLSPINTSLPDISVSVNAFQTFGLGLNSYYRNGNWNSNLGNGIFSGYNQNPFFPTYSFVSIIDTNGFYSDVFIKLRNQPKKDLVTVRYSNINVYHNDNDALTQTVQNIQNQGGVLTEVAEFDKLDRNEDLAVMGSGGVVCFYRNLVNGYLDETPFIFGITSGSQKFKSKQIDDKTFPYLQNDPLNRFDIITTQGSTAKIFINNNNNGISLNQSFDAGFSIKELEVADINDDGYNDIIVAGGNSTSTSMAKVFLNLTNGFINTNAVYTSLSGFISYSGAFLKIAVSDLNNDGFNDLTFMGYEGNTKVFINTGSGSFFSQTANQSIQILNNFGEITQVKSVDLYNTGGKALIYSAAVGGGAINERDWGL